MAKPWLSAITIMSALLSRSVSLRTPWSLPLRSGHRLSLRQGDLLPSLDPSGM